MQLADFSIGLEFSLSGARWRCTDVGMRTVVAIKLGSSRRAWYAGPPYAVEEVVLDEHDQSACTLRPELDPAW